MPACILGGLELRDPTKTHRTTELAWEVYWGGAIVASEQKQKESGGGGEKGLPFIRGYSACAQGVLYFMAAAATGSRHHILAATDDASCWVPESRPV